MTRGEWNTLAAEIVAYWPHAQLSDATLVAWFNDVQDLPAAVCSVALRALARDGREFPPTGGQIRAKVCELEQIGEVDHGEAWALAMTAVRRFGSYDPHGAREWLIDQSPITAEAVRRFGWRDLCHFDIRNAETVRAQFREVFNSLKRRAERSERYLGLAGIEPKRLRPRSMREVLGEPTRLLGEGT